MKISVGQSVNVLLSCILLNKCIEMGGFSVKYLNDVTIKDCVGKILKSKSFGDFKILKYNDATNVEIQFLKTGYEMVTQLGNIRNGKVKDPYVPSVCGVGVLGTKYPSKVNGVKTKEYERWTLNRCTLA